MSKSRDHLRNAIQRVSRGRKALLDGLKDSAIKERTRPDFVWSRIIESFSTMGSSRGYEGLMENPDRMKIINYYAIADMDPSSRLLEIERVLRDSKIRWPSRKAEYIVHNHQMMERLGGPELVTADLWNCRGKREKIDFLKQFKGIGDKQARDIMMNAFDADFQDSIAVDARIKQICSVAGLDFADYESQEEFLIQLAHEIGLTGWELDRLMYWFKDEILEEI